MIDQIRRELAAASNLDDYAGFGQVYVCIVKLALAEPDPEEFARIKTLAGRLSDPQVSRILQLPQVDDLLDIKPPLETILCHKNEELRSIETAEAIEILRSSRNSKPRKALRSLLFLLKNIRNKVKHGFKSPEGPRDREILSAARPIVVAIAESCLAMRLPLREAK